MTWTGDAVDCAVARAGDAARRTAGGPADWGRVERNELQQQVRWKLNQMAERVKLEFEYSGVAAASSADLEPYMLGVHHPEEAA